MSTYSAITLAIVEFFDFEQETFILRDFSAPILQISSILKKQTKYIRLFYLNKKYEQRAE